MLKTMERMSLAILVFLGILCILFVVWVGKIIFYPANQAQQIYEKTLNADNVIYNYEYFKQQYQDTLAMAQKAKIAKSALDQFMKDAGPREKWDFRDKEEQQRLNTNWIGARNMYLDMAAGYNARAQMVNRSIFMGKDVPEKIDPSIE